MPWAERSSTFKFDVSAPSELTVYLFDRKFDALTGPQVTSLGLIKLNPFLETWVQGEQWVDVQGGTGRVNLEVSYLEKKVLPLEDSDVWRVCREVRFGDLVRVEKSDTDRAFAMKTIRTPDTMPSSETVHHLCSAFPIKHPFIAPLEFVFKSPKGLSLLSPLASGGHLFSHLQRKRRFEVDRARIHSAELTCALEYLHGRHIILACLKPENIALDSLGRVSLCNPGLFGLEKKDGDRVVPGKAEIPAPELLLGQEASEAVDWWSLGVLLYEMLTGIPPFYHEDVKEQRRRIIDQALQLPEGLPTTARDILIKLLDKDPARRLGTNGASEVKAHKFFHDVNWLDLTQPRREALFEPSQTVTVFRVEPDEPRDSRLYHETGVQRVSEGVVEKQIYWDAFRVKFWYPVKDKDDENAPDETSSRLEDDEWELVWEPTSQEFHFNNRLTGKKRPIGTDRRPAYTPFADEYTPTVHDDYDPAIQSPRPSQSQKKDALKAALKAGYSNRVVLQILGYDVDLDDAILERVEGGGGPWYLPTGLSNFHVIWLTPLEWVVDNGNAELVELFLEKGVDANFSTFPREGPSLIKAVKKRNQKLIEMLLPRSNRVNSTRALCHAVEQQDIAITTTLLTNGVLPDFEESDRPRPPILTYGGGGCIHLPLNQGPRLKAEDFTPPLVRAARLGHASLVQLLLANGADVNAAYHVLDIPDWRMPWEEPMAPIQFSCGRAVQLAKELGHSEVVQLLLDGGADVSLAPPVWPVPGHTCPLIPRSVYLSVTVGLEELAAARREGKVAT